MDRSARCWCPWWAPRRLRDGRDNAMYDEVMDKYGFIPANHAKPIEFEVLLNGIYDRQGRKIPGHKAVVRSDTGDTLAVHSDKYSLVPYQVHFDAFEKAISL